MHHAKTPKTAQTPLLIAFQTFARRSHRSIDILEIQAAGKIRTLRSASEFSCRAMRSREFCAKAFRRDDRRKSGESFTQLTGGTEAERLSNREARLGAVPLARHPWAKGGRPGVQVAPSGVEELTDNALDAGGRVTVEETEPGVYAIHDDAQASTERLRHRATIRIDRGIGVVESLAQAATRRAWQWLAVVAGG